jgi:fructokinase
MRAGVDLGGTKIEIAVLDRSGATGARRRIPTPNQDYGATVRAIRDLVLDTESALGQRVSVGVGIPGALSPATGLVKNANATWLNGRPLDRDLGAALARPVRIANDANCFALSEAVDGAGRGCPCVFGVIAGTGVGGGIVVGGQLLTGRNAIAGEWGHNPLPWPGGADAPQPACYCGRSGCVEAWCSGPGLSRDHAARTGLTLDAEAIAQAARSGDAQARLSLDRHAGRLARALAQTVNLLDPDVIVLGGGLSRLDHLYTDLPAAMAPFVFSDACDTPIVRNVWGDSGGVRGAAWLWPEAAP